MTRPLTLPEYRALLADVAGRHGGEMGGGIVVWRTDDDRPLATLGLGLPTTAGGPYPLILRCGRDLALSNHPDAALRALDAARATLTRAIAARDELAGVVVDVSTRSTP